MKTLSLEEITEIEPKTVLNIPAGDAQRTNGQSNGIAALMQSPKLTERQKRRLRIKASETFSSQPVASAAEHG